MFVDVISIKTPTDFFCFDKIILILTQDSKKTRTPSQFWKKKNPKIKIKELVLPSIIYIHIYVHIYT